MIAYTDLELLVEIDGLEVHVDDGACGCVPLETVVELHVSPQSSGGSLNARALEVVRAALIFKMIGSVGVHWGGKGKKG